MPVVNSLTSPASAAFICGTVWSERVSRSFLVTLVNPPPPLPPAPSPQPSRRSAFPAPASCLSTLPPPPPCTPNSRFSGFCSETHTCTQRVRARAHTHTRDRCSHPHPPTHVSSFLQRVPTGWVGVGVSVSTMCLHARPSEPTELQVGVECEDSVGHGVVGGCRLVSSV